MRALRNHGMIPSISWLGRPQDNARCESFLKVFKREEIYSNDYRDLEHLAERIEEFIESYYNRCSQHSALGYLSPEEFEKQAGAGDGNIATKAATITALTYEGYHSQDALA